MSTTCHTCPIAVECAALPHGVLGCQDNGARFDADDAAVLAPYRTASPEADPAGALAMVAQAVAEWRDEDGPSCDGSDFIQAIEDAMDWHHITLPTITHDEGSE